jgi:hypothetical protein
MGYELIDSNLLKSKSSTVEISKINRNELSNNGGYHDPYNNKYLKQLFSYNKENYTTWDIRRFLLNNAPNVPLFCDGKRVTGIKSREDENGNIIGYDMMFK